MAKQLLIGAILSLLCATAHADDVSVSIGVNAPGIYGQINIGPGPRPEVIYAQPVVVAQAPEYVGAAPIYLHVPPGHEKHWSKHCAEYHACGRPVMFVRDDWYARRYPHGHRAEHDEDEGHHGEHGHGHRDDRDDHDRDH